MNNKRSIDENERIDSLNKYSKIFYEKEDMDFFDYLLPIEEKEIKEKKLFIFCEYENCFEISNYGFVGDKHPKYCLFHKKEGCVFFPMRLCGENNCDNYARYGIKSYKICMYCTNHKKINMTKIYNRECRHENCKKIALYGYEKNLHPISCFKHRKFDMINFRIKKCEITHCYNFSTHTLIRYKKANFCPEHSSKFMKSINYEQYCHDKDCNVAACFGYKENYLAVACINHLENDMQFIDKIYTKKCIHLGCLKFGQRCLKTNKSMVYCPDHCKNIDTIDLKELSICSSSPKK